MTTVAAARATCRRAGVRMGVVTAFAAAAGASSATPAAIARGPAAVAPSQELAILLAPHYVFAAPHVRRSRARTIPARRPITGVPTVLPVVGHARTDDGVGWLLVMVPGRPNGTRGWIKQRETIFTTTVWHIVVKPSTRRVLVYRRGRLARSFAVIVGKPSTPTPRGRFFVEENVRVPPSSPGAPFALATSARSNVLQEFNGGPGQIGIHGVRNIGGTLGTAVSHGCVRLADRDIRWLAARIAPGVPLTITA